MALDFEKLLKEKMDEASLNELIPGWDTEIHWHGLAQKLQTKKKPIFLPAWSYAAALLVAVLCCWFYLTQSTNEQTKIKKVTVIAPQTPNKIIVETGKPTMVTVKKETLIVKEIQRKQSVLVKINKDYDVVKDTGMVLSLDNITENKQEPSVDKSNMHSLSTEQKIPVIAINKSRQHAVNILDIENEDRQFMISKGPAAGSSSQILERMQFLITPQKVIVANAGPYPLEVLFGK